MWTSQHKIAELARFFKSYLQLLADGSCRAVQPIANIVASRSIKEDPFINGLGYIIAWLNSSRLKVRRAKICPPDAVDVEWIDLLKHGSPHSAQSSQTALQDPCWDDRG